MEIKCTIISRGTILIEYKEKKIKALGELTFDPPVFYLYKDSLKNYESPFDDVEISNIDKEEIFEFISKIDYFDGKTRIVID